MPATLEQMVPRAALDDYLREGLSKRHLAGKTTNDHYGTLRTRVPEMAAPARGWTEQDR